MNTQKLIPAITIVLSLASLAFSQEVSAQDCGLNTSTHPVYGKAIYEPLSFCYPTSFNPPSPPTIPPALVVTAGTPLAPAVCTPSVDCLYTAATPSTSTTAGGVQTLNYIDVAGTWRSFDIRVHIPTTPLYADHPVVVWSHGGASGACGPKLTKWAQATAQAGYISIAVSHTPRASYCSLDTLCSNISIASDRCPFFKYLNHDRPFDLQHVFQSIDDGTLEALIPDLTGSLNADSPIIVAGHSAGGGAAMMLAGATRAYPLTPLPAGLSYTSNRPVGFIALSPQGPLDDGFTSSSWTAMNSKRILSITGAGDSTSGTISPENRRYGHFNMNTLGSGYRRMHLWINDASIADHGAFQLSAGTLPEVEDWLVSTVVAFIDAQAKAEPAAQSWLASDSIEVESDDPSLVGILPRVEWNLR